MKPSFWNNMQSNSSIAPPSLQTHESLWIEIPCYCILIYHHTQYTVTTCSEQTVVLYGSVAIYIPDSTSMAS